MAKEEITFTDETATSPGANGRPSPDQPDPRREEFLLRAQCAKLRHWCLDLLRVEGADEALPEEVVRDLTQTPPEMTPGEVLEALRLVKFGEPIPGPTPPANPERLAQRAADLAAERDRLRKAFFALFDIAFPNDAFPSEDDLVREMQGPSEVSISEMLAEFEREHGW